MEENLEGCGNMNAEAGSHKMLATAQKDKTFCQIISTLRNFVARRLQGQL